jgi:hypothetical protein
MSYHADVMRAFSRRRFSTSCWSSTCFRVSYFPTSLNGRGGVGETYRALLRGIFVRSFELLAQCTVDGDLFLEILLYLSAESFAETQTDGSKG